MLAAGLQIVLQLAVQVVQAAVLEVEVLDLFGCNTDLTVSSPEGIFSLTKGFSNVSVAKYFGLGGFLSVSSLGLELVVGGCERCDAGLQIFVLLSSL